MAGSGMDFKELEYVLAVAEEKSISRAAQRLYISQPALSRFLGRLEKQLGGPVFQKGDRSYQLTPFGEAYVEMARSVLAIRREFERRAEELAGIQTRRLRVGMAGEYGTWLWPRLAQTFAKACPECELEVTEEPEEELERLLADGRVDLAFLTFCGNAGWHAGEGETGRHTRSEEAHDDQMYAENPEAGGNLLCREDLVEERPVFCCRRDCALESFRRRPLMVARGAACCAFLCGEGREEAALYRGIREYGVQTALALAAQGCGACLVSDFVLRFGGMPRVFSVYPAGTDTVRRRFAAVYRRGDLPEEGRRLITLLCELKSD